MHESLPKYTKAFIKLRIDRTHGIAPHKPILLLSVLQLYQQGLIQSRSIFLSIDLIALFKSNWNLLVDSNHDCRISYPFYHLKSSGFWKLVPRNDFRDIDKLGSAIKSIGNLSAAVEYAEIAKDLYVLAIDPISNHVLQQTLLDSYFPNTKQNAQKSLHEQKHLFNSIEEKILTESPADYKAEINNLIKQKDEEEIFLRGAVFKREIPKIYQNTCCMTGMRIDTSLNVSMIDACHIIPFSESHDDTISNGIALCPNLHRAFDRGLVAVDEDYRVLVSSSFLETESAYSIQALKGKKINLPDSKSLLPSIENFYWHRQNKFKS